MRLRDTGPGMRAHSVRPYRDLEVLHMKVKVMQVGPIGTNCYILEDETTNKAAVIDPGD